MAKKSNKKQQEPKNNKVTLIVLAVVAVVFLGVLIWAVADSLSGTFTNSTAEETATEGVATEATDEHEGHTHADGSTSSATTFDITHYADIDIANYGTITVALAGNVAPITVENFINLAESGFYDGLTFHRIMEGFMMQGGDPEGTGMGGADTTIVGEFTQNGYENPITHVRGAISMARSQDMDSASSQFFIVHQDSTFLDGQYAAFGYVTEGLEIVDAVCAESMPIDDNGTIPAEQQPIINSVTIRAAE